MSMLPTPARVYAAGEMQRAILRGVAGDFSFSGPPLRHGDETRFPSREVRMKQSKAILQTTTSYYRTGAPEPVLFLFGSAPCCAGADPASANLAIGEAIKVGGC
jgi:hypothetical protein